jgi:acetylornithine/succinyldiaminopimelate/putrescine aminotransferase
MKYIIDENLSGQAASKGRIIERRLNSLLDRSPIVAAVRGKGLMWAVQFTSDIGEQITNAALASGLLVNNVRPNAVRIVPPLTISDEDLEQGMAIIEHVIEAAAATGGAAK